MFVFWLQTDPTRAGGRMPQPTRMPGEYDLENVKDSYHGALLHAFNSRFGFFRSTQRGDVRIE